MIFINVKILILLVSIIILLAIGIGHLALKVQFFKVDFMVMNAAIKDAVFYQRLYYQFYNVKNSIPVLCHDNNVPYLPFDKVRFKTEQMDSEKDGTVIMKIIQKEPVLLIQTRNSKNKEIYLKDVEHLTFIKSGKIED